MDKLLLDTGTTANNSFRERIAEKLGISFTPSMPPTDYYIAGHDKTTLVTERFVNPLVDEWREQVIHQGVDPTADANKHRRGLRKLDSLPAEKRPAYTWDPAGLDDPGMVAALDAAVTLDQINRAMAEKFTTVPLLQERRALTHFKTRNAIPQSEKQTTGKWRPAASLVSVDAATATEPATLIYRVAIYHAKDAGVRSEEFHVLGTNTLADLRDRIYCSYASAMADAPPASSFFGIEGVLYSDEQTTASASSAAPRADDARGILSSMLEEELRDSLEGATSAASAVISWNRMSLQHGHDHGWGILQKAPMNVKLEELKVRLGAHYVFSHYGGCEHIVVFLDVRAMSEHLDLPQEVFYPRKTHAMRRLKKRCNKNFANFATLGDPFSTQNPSYICGRCFELLHCDEEGQVSTQAMDSIPYP